MDTNLHLFHFLVVIISILPVGTARQPAFLPSQTFGWLRQKIKEFSSQILRLRGVLLGLVVLLNDYK